MFVKRVDENLIVELYKQGLQVKEIAERAKCTEATVRIYLKKNGVRLEPLDIGKILALDKAGWRIREIADDVGCSEAEVMEVLRC